MAPAMVSASTGAMNSDLYKLATLLEDTPRSGQLLGRSTRRRVSLLKDELTSMKGLLEKLADTEDLDFLVKGWMGQVREMTYDLEDAIDWFVHMAARRGGANFAGHAVRRLRNLRLHHQFGNMLEELEERIREASERRSRYGLSEAATSSRRAVSIDDPRRPVLCVGKDSPVGMDGPSDELIALLADGQQQLKVVSIVGCGGLGKTTLARNVYEKLQLQFDSRAVVTMSQSLDIKKILLEMLSQVVAPEYDSTEAFDLPQLIDKLREFLVPKRYFVVIDDLWDTSAWSIIKFALPENCHGSRILVTTRVLRVAESCCFDVKEGHIFRMSPLTETEARALFFRRIFPSESQKCPPNLEEISMDILKRCCGLPLAIITMASMLASRPYSTQEWEKIRDFVGSSLYKDASLEVMRDTLNLSYIDLPSHLKSCFLYLSMFPEDYVIDRKRLVRRWIAEGFISAEHMEDLEEVAENYFNELLNRSLVQSMGIRYDSRVDACRVHDIILDLIISKSVEENFVISYGNHEHISGLQDRVRRLSLDCRLSLAYTFKSSEITTSHVRSLTVIGSDGQMPDLANFRALRVLDLESYGELGSHYLKNIGRLYLLKYLRLQASAVELPEEISELQYLETLDLSGAPRCKLPKRIVRLKQLIYLLVSNVKLPDGFGSMQSLQELSCIKIDSTNALQELGNLSLLKVLGLKVYADILISSLSKLGFPNLRSLYIESANGCSLDFLLDFWSVPCYHLEEFQMESNYFFPTVPKWVSSLVNLTLLRINLEVVEEEVLQILGGLPALLALLLTVKSTPSERGLVIGSNGFKRLKQFDFTCQNSLGMMKFDPGAMKDLGKLRVVFGAQGECVVNGFEFSIEHLTSLKHIAVEIKCREVGSKEVKYAEDVINDAANLHSNHPSLELQIQAEQHIVKDESEIPVHDEEDNDQNEGDNEVEHEVVVEGESTPTTES